MSDYKIGQKATYNGQSLVWDGRGWLPDNQTAAAAQDQSAPLSWGDVPGEALQNAPASLARLGGDLWNVVRHPLDTLEGLGSLVAGAAQKVAPGDFLGTGYKPYAEAVGEFYKNRYGGEDAVKNTLATDPVGALADLSMLFTGGGTAAVKGTALAGKVAGNTARAARILDMAKATGQLASKAGNIIDPVANVGRGLVAGGSKARNFLTGGLTFAEKLYQSALKPTISPRISLSETMDKVRTGIAERLPATEGGYNKLVALQNQLGKQVDDLIQARALEEAAGRIAPDIDLGSLATEAGIKAIDDFSQMSETAPIYKAITDKVDGILRSHAPTGDPIGIRKAQELKKGLGHEASAYIGTDMPDTIQGGRMAVTDNTRHGLMKAIEERVPEVGPINKRASSLYELQDDLARAAKRGQNNNIFSLTSLVGAPVWGALTGDPIRGALTALAGAGLGTPWAKSQGAFILDRFGKVIRNRLAPNYFRGGRVENEAEGGLLGLLGQD
jgi:hypothetical protein